MQSFHLIKDYKGIQHYRRSFNELAGLVFGIDFESWYRRGGWTDRYVCYSYTDAGQVVANVSVNRMDLLREGKREKALQIGTVMTHPAYRGLGLATSLLQTVLEEQEGAFSFLYLFTHEGAKGFYPRFGFVPLRESRFYREAEGPQSRPAGLLKLNVNREEDLQTVHRLTAHRAPISQVLAVERDQHILFFHCLHTFKDDLYYNREPEALILYRREGSLLHLYDVISREPFNLEQVLSWILPPEKVTVEFHFTPGLDGGVCRKPAAPGDVLLVRPVLRDWPREFRFPATSRA